MIKLIIFDLDGVLVNTRELHYESLNAALEPHRIVITRDEHLSKYDGRPTKQKLSLLTREKGLPAELHSEIWRRKQELSQSLLEKHVKPDERVCDALRRLSADGFMICVASNSIWKTVKNSLMYAGLLEYVDYFASCEQVKNPKPSPEIYLHCLQQAGIGPCETLIVEDSPIGLESASKSGAHVLPVASKEDVTYERVRAAIDARAAQPRMLAPRAIVEVNVLIPMAGQGSRFARAGYARPKPLIDVKGKPMIQRVVENLGVRANYIFVVQREHYEKYYLDIALSAIAPGCKIVCLNGMTEGAACTVLMASEFINNDAPLMLANSDQYLEWNSYEFLYRSMSNGVDGCISTFKSSHAKFSYAAVGDSGYVERVAEKDPISEHATTGVYYWRRGSDFVKYAQSMIADDANRVNGEFYVAPVYNEAIKDGKKIKIAECKAFHCLGTPEDLESFLAGGAAAAL